MKVKVVKHHPSAWELVQFPTFPKGTAVTLTKPECDEDFLYWWDAVIDGHDTFVPQSFLTDGKLNRAYNPTELRQEVGDILTVQEIVNAWVIATNEQGVTGWIPAEVVVSI